MMLRRAKLGRAFSTFWLARTLSIGGDQIALVALTAHAYQIHHSTADVSAIMLAFAVPRLASPIFGAIADGLEARRLMVVLDVAQAGLVALLLAFVDSIPVQVADVCVLTLISACYLPAGRRSIARLAPPAHMRHAYAAIGTSWNLGWALGPALGGLLAAFGGLRLALGVDAATFIASALLMRLLPALPVPDDGAMDHRRVRTVLIRLRSGMSLVASNRIMRAVVLGLFLVVAFGSVDAIAIVLLATSTFRSGSAGYGLLLSAAGVGMIFGSLISMTLRRLSTANLIFIGQFGFAIGAMATGAAPGLLAALATQGAAGCGNGIANVASDVITQETVSEAVLGTVGGVLTAVPFLGNLVAYSVAPALLDEVGPRWTFIASGAGVAIVAIVVRLVMRPPGGSAPEQPRLDVLQAPGRER